MRIRSIIAAIALVASPAFADPRKPDPQETQDQRRVPVILAAAETPQTLSAETAQPASPPVKRRFGRITTCRCGDPQPGARTPEQ